jgi:N-acetyl-gamma-glutamyl-phosphate reductase
MPAVAAARAAGARVVDLSADFRLHDPAVYQRWYGIAHTEPALLAQAVYGLPELHRAAIAPADLVANPGCYPTSVILGLAPLARAGWLHGQVIADSKSGVSGAGRKPKLNNSFVEANENLSPYSIGYSHRHIAEMEQELSAARRTMDDAGQDMRIVFSPHLLPVSRGILSTIYVSLPNGVDQAAVRAAYAEAYAHEPFVHLLPTGQVATLHHTVHSNRCAIGLTFVPDSATLIVTSTIDNLLKGASGQAVQNMNVMFGLAETMGLDA